MAPAMAGFLAPLLLANLWLPIALSAANWRPAADSLTHPCRRAASAGGLPGQTATATGAGDERRLRFLPREQLCERGRKGIRAPSNGSGSGGSCKARSRGLRCVPLPSSRN